jgi:hypothetical protein
LNSDQRPVSVLGTGRDRKGRLNLPGSDASNDLPVLVLEDPFQFLLGIIRRIYEIQVGSLVGMNNCSAHIDSRFDPPLSPRLRLDVIDDAIVLNLGVEPCHHPDTPRPILLTLTSLPGMLAASHPPGKKKLDTLLGAFV